MTDHEQSGDGSDPGAAPPKDFESSARRLDRENLPDEFTVEFLKNLPLGDLEWLEEEAELTPRQRATYAAASKELLAPFREAIASALSGVTRNIRTMRVPGIKWPQVVSPFARARDPLGDDIQKTIGSPNSPAPGHR